MPKIYTNNQKKPVPQRSAASTDPCIISYQDYSAQRTLEPIQFTDIQKLTEAFKVRISDPLDVLNPDLEIGQYFVIPVAELQDMLAKAPKAEYVHVCNALRDTTNSSGDTKTFPITVLVPVEKTVDAIGASIHQISKSDDSIYIEAYPCPPDPRCPAIEVVGTVFKQSVKINDFKSLF